LLALFAILAIVVFHRRSWLQQQSAARSMPDLYL
jgi:hypothetical protein